MKTALAATLFAVASFPLLGQQVPPTNPTDQQTNPATQQTNPAAAPGTPASRPETSATPPTTPSSSDSQATAPDKQSTAAQIPAADMRPVDGKLVNKLDSRTAKTGDDVILQTESSVKTADGTEIPKGSKLVGHVLAVHPSAGQNSQVVLRFDRAEIKGGKSLPIQSEIESVEPAAGEVASASAAEAPPMPSRDSSTIGNAAGNTASASGAAGTSSPAYAQPGTAAPMPGSSASAAAGSPAAGTIVSRNGNIAIRTTSIPGILLANNAPGEQDPRMAQASGFLLGAKKDVQLNDGTKMTLKVATANSANSTSSTTH